MHSSITIFKGHFGLLWPYYSSLEIQVITFLLHIYCSHPAVTTCLDMKFSSYGVRHELSANNAVLFRNMERGVTFWLSVFGSKDPTVRE